MYNSSTKSLIFFYPFNCFPFYLLFSFLYFSFVFSCIVPLYIGILICDNITYVVYTCIVHTTCVWGDLSQGVNKQHIRSFSLSLSFCWSLSLTLSFSLNVVPPTKARISGRFFGIFNGATAIYRSDVALLSFQSRLYFACAHIQLARHIVVFTNPSTF